MVFSKSQVALAALYVLGSSQQAFARMRWMERDNRAVLLNPRRFGQEHPAVIDKLSAACEGQVCGVLAGQAITPLLAAQGECTQQDMADQIIDAAQQFDDTTKANMIALAVEYRQVEKNTPPDFSVQPNILRNSVFCQKAPKNSELNGLVQAQDPANDPNAFFDPATSSTVQKGSQANTFPFGTSGSSSDDSASSSVAATSVSSTASAASTAVLVAASSASPCETVVTVTVTAAATDAATDVASATAASSSSAAAATSTASSTDIGNFGSCSIPQIEFGAGFDGRKETSFEPVDKASYNHGSAQGIDIITQFICDTLTNSCGADATAKATCATAKAAADTGTAKTGEQADLFNAAFGIQTSFADVVAIDDQGNAIPGTGSAAAQEALTSGSGGIGDFGSCSVPQIKFGTGFDNRKETSFEPADQTSYNHGSAQNIDIITQFICDTLTNSCNADATAKATCARAVAAADTGAAKTGIQADLFNAVFGIATTFSQVPAVDDTGVTIAGSTGTIVAVSATATAVDASTTAAATAATTTAAASTTAAATATTSSAAAATSSAAAASGDNLQTFTGALGGVTAPEVTDIGNGQFQVEGNSAFNALNNALERSCDVQHNQCANAANASGNQGDLTVSACGDQQTQCQQANGL